MISNPSSLPWADVLGVPIRLGDVSRCTNQKATKGTKVLPPSDTGRSTF